MTLVKTLLEVGGVLAAMTLLLILAWVVEARLEGEQVSASPPVVLAVEEVPVDPAAAA